MSPVGGLPMLRIGELEKGGLKGLECDRDRQVIRELDKV
jgi:hypothetical protein